jgi:hypothetical protein
MALQFKNNIQQQPSRPNIPATTIQQLNIPFVSIGTPPGIPSIAVGRTFTPRESPKLKLPGQDLPRAVDYCADYGGCGYWRMLFPNMMMNINQKAAISNLTQMSLDPRFYESVKAVRLQRQATPIQLRFTQFLKELGTTHHNYKVIYEIDDIIFKEDIPDYNRCKAAFNNEEVLRSSIEMMQMSDEISVTCQYMKDYYIEKTGNKNITVIPNYAPKFWMDKYYPEKIIRNYEKNKKKPRIAYIGSGTHFDLANKTNQMDDFYHVVDAIIKSRKDFTWVFIGGFPLRCKPFIDSGEMEFIQWFPLLNLSDAYTITNIQAVYAPLSNCHFNKAKSNIKYMEAAYHGIPGVFQDIETYKMAPLKFNTGSELIDQLNGLLKNQDNYIKQSKKAREYGETMFLDDKIEEYLELYFTQFGSIERKALLKNNP